MAQRFLLICTVKDEGPNILEWVAYHRSIGFTDIVVFENNSFDLTDRALRVMHRAGAITYLPNNFRPDHPNPPFQNRAYRRASRLPAYLEADWCIALDADEFLLINAGEGQISDLVAAAGSEADEIRLNWRVFGSSGLRELDDRLVTERFTMTTAANHVATHPHPVKTLFRPKYYARPGIHLPKKSEARDPVIVTGSGVPIEETEVRGFMSTDPGEYTYAQINHYMVRDSDSFLIKASRGSSSNTDRKVRLGYWKKRDRNFVADTRLADRAPALREAMAALDKETGGRLLAMRARSLRFWRKRLAALKAKPEFQELYEALR